MQNALERIKMEFRSNDSTHGQTSDSTSNPMNAVKTSAMPTKEERSGGKNFSDSGGPKDGNG
jgi:hypothetical protein